jgi:murein DD-endopeptidase MepM/ murein hydrolase activator NlpD
MGVYVSQGYNGGMSHKGLTAYAIDFPLPVGTPIYAAREGVVVGAEGSNTLGAASPEYRRYANYVIVEHDDGTMGNYYHLRQGGAAVRIGEKVKKGQLIAYSGNTGYTSGAHLHFSVSTVDPVSMRRPMNLPIKIQTAEGIVTNPHQGDRYTVL